MVQAANPRIFTLIRRSDYSGVSGTGRVLDGILFPNGKVVVCWRVKFKSVGVYESFEAFKSIHIDSHPTNNSEIVWMEFSALSSVETPTLKPLSNFT